MTKIIALGTGSAFTMKGWQTNYIIQKNGKNLLVDCGGDIRFSLRDTGFSFKDIDAIYVSHAHQDHSGGLEFMGFARYFTRQGMIAQKVENPIELCKLFCESNLIKSLWKNTLKGGMAGLEGIEAKLSTYFNTFPVEKNSSFEWEGLVFDIVQSLHISSKYSIVDSFGLIFTDEDGNRIYLTTDVQFAPETSLKAYYKESNFIIHDCETMYKSDVHSHYDDLKTLPKETKEKMLLIHYQDNVIDDFDNWNDKAKSDGFIGFAVQGCIFDSSSFKNT
jgi:ribonuclease BN (tRNA processing enzyme)